MTLGPGRTIVGRESGDILLRDPEASALHAEIEFTNGHVIVRDLGSRNGTWREGKRLPQFALYRGQTFRCGTTDITLVDILGADAPLAGGTASGRDGVPSSSTLPSAAVLDETAGETTSHGVLPPSSSPTAPGLGPEPADRTLVGPVPRAPAAPLASPPRSSPVPPPGFSPPSGAPAPLSDIGSAPTILPPPGAPVPIGDVASAPVIMPPPGAPMPVGDASSAPVILPPPGAPMAVGDASSAPVILPPAGPPPPGVPVSVPVAPSAPIAPVRNAVIKLGDAQPKRSNRPSPEQHAARRRLVKRVLLGVAGAGLLGVLVFGIVTLVMGRNQAFLQQLAREMPQDTVGVLAVSSPRDALGLFGDEVPPELREQLKEDLGLDPFAPETLEAWGFDPDEPMGISLLDGDGMVAISVGVKDRDVMRAALSKKAAELLKADEDLRWIERAFGELPGLWLDEPAAVAALLPKNRVIFVLGGSSDDVARHAKRIAETERGETLADRPGFGEIQNEKGKLLLALYVDGASGRAALPGEGLSVMAASMALGDIDGYAVLLSDDGPQVHLSMQTIMREGVEALAIVDSVKRKGKLLDTIPGPVLAELDGVFSAEQLSSRLSDLGPMGMMRGVEEEFRKETSLDLRTDVLDNLDGQYGVVLQKLPGEDEEAEPGAVLLWAGLRDEAAAKKTVDRFYAKMGDELDIELEQIEGTTAYRVGRRPAMRYFVHGNVLWLAVDEGVDLPALIKGTGEPFRKQPRIPAIGKATDPGGLLAGFVDIHEILAVMRKRLDDDDLEELDKWSSVLSPLEALSVRAEVDGRTFVSRFTLHTSGEHALAELVRGLTKVAGQELAEDLARERRRERCDKLIDHIIELMRTELKSNSFETDLLDHRYELTTECRSEQTTDAEIDCMLSATTLDALPACEAGGQAPPPKDDDTPVKVIEQPEPVPVPYVDDLWPHTTPTGDDKGRPDPAANYAVPLGTDPVSRGPEDALVTVVMFGDFQCPYCKRVLPTLDQLLSREREVRVVFRHHPLTMHDQAEGAARAAVAAGRQGKFWEMHDKLYEQQTALSEDAFRTLAAGLGLDMVRFDRDYADAEVAAQVRADMADAKKFGATGTPSFFVNGRFLAGSQPLETFERVVAEEKSRAERFVERRGKTRKRLYEDMIGHFAPEVVKPAASPVVTPVAETRHTIDVTGLPRRGTAGFARVEIVECGDFDCPFCQRAITTLDSVLKDYEGKVALFWLHNPLSFHPGALPAARAAVAANNQGKFWEMHDKLFADRDKRSDADFIGYAAELGLDTIQFERDLNDGITSTTVTEQTKICNDNEARGTPTFFINGRLLAGAQSYDKFKEVIDQELAGGI